MGAPFEAVQFALDILDHGAAVQLIEHVPVGTIGPAHELARRQRSPANDIGAAVLLLMRSGHPRAIAAVENWLATQRVAPTVANPLLVVSGWLCIDGKLHRLWGQRTAHRLARTYTGELELYASREARCLACKHPLVCLVQGTPNTPLPFSLFTCANCTAGDFDRYLVEVSADGQPRSLLLQDVEDDFRPTVEHSAAIKAVRATLQPATRAVPDLDNPDFMTRIGGAPSWAQGPTSAGLCPNCKKPLAFAAQFSDPPGEPWSGLDPGLLYAFICEDCRVTATFVQQY